MSRKQATLVVVMNKHDSNWHSTHFNQGRYIFQGLYRVCANQTQQLDKYFYDIVYIYIYIYKNIICVFEQ